MHVGDVEKGRFSNTAQSRNSSTDFLHFQRRSLQILPLLSQIGPHVFGGVKQVRPAQGRLCEKWRYCRERQKLEPPRIIDMSLEKEVKISLEESIVFHVGVSRMQERIAVNRYWNLT